MTPTVTSSSLAAADGLLITKVATLAAPLLGAALLTALYTRMATTTLSSSRFGASVTLRRTQSPCALCRGDRAGFPKKETREAGGLAEPLARCPLEERSLAEGKTLGEASLGMGSLSRLGEPGP